jgi:hypothetical protein
MVCNWWKRLRSTFTSSLEEFAVRIITTGTASTILQVCELVITNWVANVAIVAIVKAIVMRAVHCSLRE